MKESLLIHLNQLDSSYLVLLSLAGLGIAAAILIYAGLATWIFCVLGRVVRGSIRRGFLLWERLFAWASWPLFLAIVLGLVLAGWAVAGSAPGLTVVCALVPLLMGVTACLAYMYIDLERYEVGRGYKSVHNPLMGQVLALDLVKYGPQVGIPLLASATVGIFAGFALLNQGLYETVGRNWFVVGEAEKGATYADFLAYALINFLRIVDVLNISRSNHFLGVTYVQQVAWPASTLLAMFRMFFTLVLLQQLFASLRLGQLLTETITDFWNPHGPIHERARNALPQHGAGAIEPLLLSLHAQATGSVASLTKEQRDRLPPILAAMGPAIIPALCRHLGDPYEHVRAVAAAALGRLHACDQVSLLVKLADDPSDVVRQSLVEALGLITAAGAPAATAPTMNNRAPHGWSPGRGILRYFAWKRRRPVPVPANPIELAIATLQAALADDSAAVRTQAAKALGRTGPALVRSAGQAVALDLIRLLKDVDETVRCEAAEALGAVGEAGAAVNALVELLQDASPPVKASAARALGALKTAAAPAIPALVPLLQDREESVRTATAEAIGQLGHLNGQATGTLIQGLDSPDNVVRAQTAEALGTIGTPAQHAAPALVAALTDRNDVVRARAVQALGKIGEAAADVAVPSLVRALRDQDNWVSALAADALGLMGDSADEAIPALIRSLGHMNPQVRANAAESLGKMGAVAIGARSSLEAACCDEDGGVRSQALRALGAFGRPTPASAQAAQDRLFLAGLQDPDPLVRAAAVEGVGQLGNSNETVLSGLMPLLDDPNDQVKVAVTKVLPKLVGRIANPAVLAETTTVVIAGLCRRLLEDDSVWVQVHAGLALAKLGPAAQAAGGPLLHAAQTGEVTVREQAMRALAVIQPPEAATAFMSGLKDVDSEIRKVASAGWMKAAAIPEEAIPTLVEALRDPDTQVRANAAHALARLDVLPAGAVPLLILCTADASDGLRLNATLALQLAPPGAVGAVMRHLVEDANLRIRLIAAGFILLADAANTTASAVVAEALSDPTVRLRKAALALIESLGPGAVSFLDTLRQHVDLEEEPEVRDATIRLIGRLDTWVPAEPQPISA
jgi:HEAT repeat protein